MLVEDHISSAGYYADYGGRIANTVRQFIFSKESAMYAVVNHLHLNKPELSIRRVLDELVQLSEGLYLGKAYVKWYWGRWQTVAFFLLRDNQ